MALYEHVFLARQDLAQAQVDALAANALEIIEKNTSNNDIKGFKHILANDQLC